MGLRVWGLGFRVGGLPMGFGVSWYVKSGPKQGVRNPDGMSGRLVDLRPCILAQGLYGAV